MWINILFFYLLQWGTIWGLVPHYHLRMYAFHFCGDLFPFLSQTKPGPFAATPILFQIWFSHIQTPTHDPNTLSYSSMNINFCNFFGIVINTVFSNCEMSVGTCLVMVFLNLYAMVPIVWQCVRINFDATSTEIDLKVEGRHWHSDHVHLTNVNLLSWEQFACFIVVIMHNNVFKRWLFNFTRWYF